MGRKGASTGLKRKPAPRFWPIHRKDSTWVVRPASGPHRREDCMPLVVVLRDRLGVAKTRKEAKFMVSQGRILVDGKVKKEDDFPIGLADVLSIPDIDQSYRVLPSYKGLILHSIDKEEAKFKLCRIEDKKVVDKTHLQLNLHDGSNITLKTAGSEDPQEDVYETLGTLKLVLPEREIAESLKMKEKDYAIITGGKNIGKHGKIVEIETGEGKKRRNALVTVEDKEGNRFQTVLNFVFAIGETKPLMSLPEAA